MEPFRCGRGGFGDVGGQCDRRAGVEGEFLEPEDEVADLAMMEGLAAGAMLADVVGAPTDTEVLASRGELPDKGGKT